MHKRAVWIYRENIFSNTYCKSNLKEISFKEKGFIGPWKMLHI